MRKKIIRLTESDLRKLVKNSVRKIIKESSALHAAENVKELISSTRENLVKLKSMLDDRGIDKELKSDIASFLSSLHLIDYWDFKDQQEELEGIGDEDDYDWFDIASNTDLSPEERKKKFNKRFGSPEDQDEYYSSEKYYSDTDAAWDEHDRQIKNDEKSYKRALKSADRRPLYRKNSPNNDIPTI